MRTVSTRSRSAALAIAGLALALAAVAASPGLAAEPSARRPSPPRPRLGINFAGLAYYSSELPFVDVFKMSQAFTSQEPGKKPSERTPLDLDEHGWVKRLPQGARAETPLCSIKGNHYPGGLYTVRYEGKGVLDFAGAAKQVSESPGKVVIRVDPAKGGFILILKSTDPSNYLRNIRVLMPGFEDASPENPWNPAFLALWRGMACLRFMDMMRTNNSTVSTWSDRPHVEDANYTKKGVPAELLVDLANRLGADAWFCIPHAADDEYISNLGKLVAKGLDPKLKAYVEYSNEVWNGMFKQNTYAGQEGMKLGLADKPWTAAWAYTAHRSIRIFTLWEEAFGGTERLVRVLPSHAANDFIAEKIVPFEDAYKHADALAIAPYLSMPVGPKSKVPTSEVTQWSADRVLEQLEKVSLPKSITWIQKNKAVADKYGLKLIAYEGGQHMIAVGGSQNDKDLLRLFEEANASPRIAKIYDAYLNAWVKEGGDLFCYFSSTGVWSKFGCWGLLQYQDEDPQASPKYRAVASWAKSLGQEIGGEGKGSPARRRK